VQPRDDNEYEQNGTNYDPGSAAKPKPKPKRCDRYRKSLDATSDLNIERKT
jgi:hypothetical protein